MNDYLTNLSFSEIEGKEKMMVVRVSLDLYNLISENAENAGVTVSGLVRSIFAFNYYPEILTSVLRSSRADLAEIVQEGGLEGIFSEYEEKLNRLAAEADVFDQVLLEERKRLIKAQQQIREIIEEIVLDIE